MRVLNRRTPGSWTGCQPPLRAPCLAHFYYGWIVVAVLAVTVTVSYGVLMYAFPVVLAAMEAELGWSRQMLTAGYSLGALAGGLAGVPIGRWMDRHGPHGVMTVCAMGASLLVGGWAHVGTPGGFYLTWIGLGMCSAGLFYEPAFTTIAQWFRADRARAFAIVTVAGGLASTIFVPVTASLMNRFGWRMAVFALACVLAVGTIVPHAWALRRRPPDLGLDREEARGVPGGEIVDPPPSLRSLLALRSLRWLTLAFCLSSLANMAFAIHLIPLLLGRGHPLAFASLALGSVGVMKLVGRVLIVAVARRTSMAAATVVVLGLQGIGMALLTAFHGASAVWACVALVGIGDGASTTARADLIAEFYGIRTYGAVSGVMALFQAIARAVGPVGASVVVAVTGGYLVPLIVMTGILVSAGGALRIAARRAAEAPDIG